MYRMCGLSRLKIIMLFGYPLRPTFDQVEDASSPESVGNNNVDGMQRVRSMFSRDQYGDFGKEFYSCLQGTFTGLFVGAAYGGFIWSRRAYLDFIENNQATAFANHFEAKKALQNYVTVNFAQGAVKWGGRVGIFTGLFMLVSTTVSVYRDKTGIFEYVVGGGITGSLFRTHLGLPGMIVGGLLGTTLGTCAGCVVHGLLKLSNVNMEEVREMLYKLKQVRDAAVAKNFNSTKEEDPLFTYHDDQVQQTSHVHSMEEK